MTFNFKAAVWPSMAAAGVLVLVGCSQGADSTSAANSASTHASGGAPSAATAAKGELAIPADADDETRRAYIAQNVLAACMRAKGFTYTPHVIQFDNSLEGVDGQDYKEAKKFRDKYGFGIYAGAVYRNDPNVRGSDVYDKKDTSPDAAYRNSLTPAQKKAYDKALGGRTVTGLTPGCQKEAEEEAYGPGKSKAEIERQATKDRARALAAKQALNGDPQIVALAQKFASCLTKQGINVTTTQPTEIGDMVKFQLSDQTPPNGILTLNKSDAAAKLTQEIDLAKKDLACGKDFRAAYFPKLAKHPFEDVTG
ncbi:hypothetical protein ACIBAC_40785 [Streptomyces sp. NPDC051362]|uniref:hypothetical protein n=1 Tax=Streptomyces sp. NPDC051362 TaxID=3365651 RepID=UPI00378CC4D7